MKRNKKILKKKKIKKPKRSVSKKKVSEIKNKKFKFKKKQKEKNLKKFKVKLYKKESKKKELKKKKHVIKKNFIMNVKVKKNEYFSRLKINFNIFLEKLKIKQLKKKLLKHEKLLKNEKRFADKQNKDRINFRVQIIKEIKREEKQKIYRLKDNLWNISERFQLIRKKYKEYRQNLREKQLVELEIRRKTRDEARAILEAEKDNNALKQKLVERLERYSRNMKSIVFQINKRYITKKRAPLRFIDNITHNGECLIKNDDAPTNKDYLILLYVDGDDINQRLVNPVCLDDKTDIDYQKNFQPKNIFEASDYIIDRLATMFEQERKLKK